MSVAMPCLPRRALLAAQIAAVLLFGSAHCDVHAQDATAAPAKPAQPAKATVLETITVTAEKRSENLQTVPIAITVITPEKLQAFGDAGDTVLALAARAPSVYAETSYGREFPRFYIRGLGNSDFDLNASQPVSMVYDDIVQENPILKGFPLFDLSQVEVLRGPQGTLFGRNSPAGVIKFDSVKPSQDTSGYASVSYGSKGTANVEAALGGSLGGNWSGRISVLGQHRDNWINNDYNDRKDALGAYNDRAIRLQALYQASDNFSAEINTHARKLQGTANVNYANGIEQGGDALVPGVSGNVVTQNGRNEQNLFTWGSNLHLNWNFNNVSLTSITGFEHANTYSLGDVDGGYAPYNGTPVNPAGSGSAVPFDVESADGAGLKQLTQEIRLASRNWDTFNWQAGAYYFYENLNIHDFGYDPTGNTLASLATQHQVSNSYALFASAEYKVADDFTLRAGTRWSHDKKKYDTEWVYNTDPTAPIGVPLTANPDYSHWTGDLTGTWAWTKDVNLYAKVSSGYRAPSLQGRSYVLTQAKAETIVSEEIGIKTLALDGKLRFNADIYKYIMHNQQLTAVGGDSNLTQLLNAKKTDGHGAEFDAEAYVTPHFILTAGGSYNFTKLRDPNLSVAACGGGTVCTILDPLNAEGNADINGNTLPNAPKWIGTLTARYGIPYGDSGEFFAYTDWNYRSKVDFFLYNSAEFNSKPLLTGGLRMGYNWDFGKREIALYGRNITNKRSISGAIDFDNRTAFISDPRIIGVEFRADL